MKPNILIVDDELNIREMLAMLLQINGYQAVQAVDGLDALEKIQEQLPDAIILDVMMPNMDGITLCKRLREQPETADLPIMILSGKAHLNAEEEGLAAGANIYMFKPMETQALLSNINHILQTYHGLQPA